MAAGLVLAVSVHVAPGGVLPLSMLPSPLHVHAHARPPAVLPRCCTAGHPCPAARRAARPCYPVCTAGVVRMKEQDLDFDNDADVRVLLLVHDTKPPFLDGRFLFTKQKGARRWGLGQLGCSRSLPPLLPCVARRVWAPARAQATLHAACTACTDKAPRPARSSAPQNALQARCCRSRTPLLIWLSLLARAAS